MANRYVFWPDKATTHYAKNTQELLINSGVDFVEKNIYPTNLPQCRPIENYFGRLSQLVYAGGWCAKNSKAYKKDRKIVCTK